MYLRLQDRDVIPITFRIEFREFYFLMALPEIQVLHVQS